MSPSNDQISATAEDLIKNSARLNLAVNIPVCTIRLSLIFSTKDFDSTEANV